ncbi:hypothetical protein AB1Y20_020569 [Prymnesium parvum]|uniref:UNC-50 family protein n=1 Tax=Prymnesium parvum TaxID=97485 RepID=A0AB34JVM4_PRYPA
MLPLSELDEKSSSTSLPEFVQRMTQWRHMDFEYSLWQMLQLCVNPTRVYRTTLYHSRTKHAWARDDPAFVVVVLYLLLITAVAWSLAFGDGSFISFVKLFAYVVLVDFVGIGAALATLCWWLANTYLHQFPERGDEWAATSRREMVEWRYAFDVHCNSFLPMSLLLHVGQYLLLPVLLREGVLAIILSNTLYALAFSIYHYLTFLGYSELPFLTRVESFVYPIGVVLLAYVLSLLCMMNVTSFVTRIYFG